MSKSRHKKAVFALISTIFAALNCYGSEYISGSIINDKSTPIKREITIPTVDISKQTDRHVIIAQGTEEIRHGHPSTLLMPDGKTMFVAWTYEHGGALGPMKKSIDGGLTWSGLLEVPNNWSQYENCPPLYRLSDSEGVDKLFIFANRKIRAENIVRTFPLDSSRDFQMYQSFSTDEGATWSPMQPSPLSDGLGFLSENSLPTTVMPFTAIVPTKDGKTLLGFSNLRRGGEWGRSNVVSQSYSKDGGLTWSHWRVILDLGSDLFPCEPEVIRSPDGVQLLMIIRENNRALNSWLMVSNNEGKTWSEPFQATGSITMDRHQAEYAHDGRLVIVGRDVAEESSTNKHFIAWVGTYEDLIEGNEGGYRIKLLHTYKTTEYPGLELLPDGTFVATNSVSYRSGENYSIVSTRFKLEETDRLAEKLSMNNLSE